MASPLSDRQFDIMIVGAGIAGAYVAYRLSALFPSLAIGVVEKAPEVGGRLRTRLLADAGVHVELGGEFLSDAHQNAIGLARHFGVTLAPVQFARAGHWVRGRMLRESELRQHAPRVFALDPAESGEPLSLLLRAIVALAPELRRLWPLDPNRADARETLDYLESLSANGLPLKDQSFRRATDALLSAEAHAMIAATAGAGSNLMTGNAVAAIITLLWEGRAGQCFYRAEEGLQSLPRAMLTTRASTLTVACNHQLTHIAKSEEGFRARISTPEGPIEVTARQIVLALPVSALRAIDFASALMGEDFTHDLETLDPVAASKLVLAFPATWWGRAGAPQTDALSSFHTDLPLQQFYLRANPQGGGALLTALSYGEASGFWSTAGADPNHVARTQAAMVQLARIFPNRPLPAPIAVAFADWRQESAGCGWHAWTRGAACASITQRMRQPNPAHRIFICGEAFALPHGWVETAINNAEVLLERCFGAPGPSWVEPSYPFEF